MAGWLNRSLDALYASLFFDALRVQVRDERTLRNKALTSRLAPGYPNGRPRRLAAGRWTTTTSISHKTLAYGSPREYIKASSPPAACPVCRGTPEWHSSIQGSGTGLASYPTRIQVQPNHMYDKTGMNGR